MDVCPTDSALAALLEARSTADERMFIENHIDTCASCRKLLGPLVDSQQHAASEPTDRPCLGDLVSPLVWKPPTQIDEFQLLQLVGQGQMGQVYAAYDQKLERRVALKLLRRSEPDDASRKRLRIEAQATARLSHPAVVAVYRAEVFEGHPYIVSEYVEGQSLEHCEKPMPWSEVLRIGLSIARGLDAAHQAGVLHRDIKPANVMLGKGREVKLLDFGLAKLVGTLPNIGPNRNDVVSLKDGQSSMDAQLSMTRSNTLVGTPRYMAPEVWLGESATAKTDLYSLGCVLYELCTGRAPFLENDIVTLRDAVLERSAQPLNQVIPSIPAAFASAVMCCLQRDTAKRPKDARALCSLLEQVEPARSLLRNKFLHFGAATLVAGSLCLFYLNDKNITDNHTIDAPAKNKFRGSIAMFGFQDKTGKTENQWMSTAFGEVMKAGLRPGGQIRIIPDSLVYQLKKEINVLSNGDPSEIMINKIRGYYLNIDAILTGEYVVENQKNGRNLILKYRLIGIKNGSVLAAAEETARADELVELGARAAEKLRQRLGLPRTSVAEYNAVRASLPESSEGARAYAEGLLARQRMEYITARERLEYAAQLSPMNSNIQRVLALVYLALGHNEKQKDAALNSIAMSASLQEEDRIAAEIIYNQSIMNYSHAIELQRKLCSKHSNDIECGFDLANMQALANNAEDSISTLKNIARKFPWAAENDPRLELIAEWPYRQLGDYASALQAARRAEEKAVARASPYLMAKARTSEGWSYYQMGNYEKSESVLERASEEFRKNWPHDLAWALMGSANAKMRMGKITEAISVFDEQKEVLEKIKSTNNLVFIDLYSGGAELERGNLVKAIARTEDSLRMGRENSNELIIIGSLIQLAQIYLDSGKLVDTRRMISELRPLLSKRRGLVIGGKSSIGRVSIIEGSVQYFTGATKDAQRSLLSAVDALTEVKDYYRAATARIVLAEFALDKKDVLYAEKLARSAIAFFQSGKVLDYEWRARAVLARALLLQGRTKESSRQLDTIRERAAHSENYQTRVDVVLAAAQLDASSKNRKNLELARSNLETAVAEAKNLGFVSLRFKLELALVEVLRKQGARADAQKLLNEKAMEAHALGLFFYEHSARALLKA